MYIMYIMESRYVTHMEDKVVEIAELRRTLGDRIEAAHFRKEPTLIRHGKRRDLRAAIIPAEWLDELYAFRAKAAETEGEQQ